MPKKSKGNSSKRAQKKKDEMEKSDDDNNSQGQVDVMKLDESSLLDVVGGAESTGNLSSLAGMHSGSEDDDSTIRVNVLEDGSSVGADEGLAYRSMDVDAEGNSDDYEEFAAAPSSPVAKIKNSSFQNTLHEGIASPIGQQGHAMTSSFLDVDGDEELRGAGTPPDSVIGESPYSFSGKSKRSGSDRPPVSETSRLLEEEEIRSNGHISVDMPARPDVVVRQMSDSSGKSKSSKKSEKNKDLSTRELRKKHASIRRKIWIFTIISLTANVSLFTFKVMVSVSSRSLAVMASAVDSFLDLVSQLIIYFALQGSRDVDEKKYPVGRNRLEPIGIIVCASLMGIAALQLVYESIMTLIRGTIGGEDITTLVPNTDEDTVILLGSAIVIKAILFLLCNSQRDESDSMMVLAEDHRNDVLSNSIALATAYLSNAYVKLWFLDPIGGISIAVYICVMWILVALEQAAMLEGVAAEPMFLEKVRDLANTFHEKMYVDVVRAYHFGKRYLVEVEVVLPGQMIVVDAHDISLELQKKIERLENVERAFVHVDYQTRDEDEHKLTYYATPQTTPSGAFMDDTASDRSRTSSIDVEEEVQVLGDIYQKANPGPTSYKKHIHVTHHRHSTHAHHDSAGQSADAGQHRPRLTNPHNHSHSHAHNHTHGHHGSRETLAQLYGKHGSELLPDELRKSLSKAVGRKSYGSIS